MCPHTAHKIGSFLSIYHKSTLTFILSLPWKKVAIASTGTKDAVKMLTEDLGGAMSTLVEARDKINMGFEDLIKDQYALAAESGGIDVNGLEFLDIKAGGVIMSVTRGTLTQIKGSRLEAIFSGRWDKHLLRDGNGRVFMDINPKCFW